jgi:rare lipoprotein A
MKRLVALTVVLGGLLAGCGSSSPRFTTSSGSMEPASHSLEGYASYYAEEFDGRPTANGETFDMNALTAAHRTLPFNTRLRVVNLENGRSVVVRVNDRGPFKDDRMIDLSLAAAKEVGLILNGTARVRLEVLELGTPKQ